jgi:hypothetical protein
MRHTSYYTIILLLIIITSVSEGYALPILYNHTVERFIVLTSQRSIVFRSLTKHFHSPGTLNYNNAVVLKDDSY